MSKPGQIAREVAAGIAHTCSAILNTVAFGGDMHTSTSAAHHLRQDHPAWRNRRRFINALFFWQADHCKGAWEADYARALAKVAANKPEAKRMTKDNAPKIIKASGGAVVDLRDMLATPQPKPKKESK